MVGGAAKVIPIEVDISAYANATGGVYLAAAGPFLRGPTTPQLMTNPVQFLNTYTPLGNLLAGYDSSYWEIMNLLSYTNLIWVVRATSILSPPLFSGAYIRANTSGLANGPIEFGLQSVTADYDLNQADGRPVLADSVVTFDSDEEWLTVPPTLYASLATADTVTLTTTGTLPVGFSTGTTYYVFLPVGAPANKIQLCSSSETAYAGEPIAITSYGIGTQTITVTSKDIQDTFTANYSTGILTVNTVLYNTIATGDPVQLSNAGGALPAGLLSATTYYAIKTLTSQQIMLASDFNNAISTTPIPLSFTTNGTGTQTLTDGVPGGQVTSFVAKTVVGTFTIDQSNGTMAVVSDWYSWAQTGDEVNLYEAGTAIAPDTMTFGTTYYLYKTPTINKVALATTLLNAQNGVVLGINNPGSGTVLINNMSATSLDVLSETNEKVLLIYATSAGAWGDGISFTLTNYATNPQLVKEPGTFLIQVYYNGAPISGEAWTCTRNPTLKNLQNQAMYIEDVLQASQYINAVDNVAVASSILPNDQLTPLGLFYGSDGGTVSDGDMNNALNQLSNSNNFPLNIVTDSDWTTPSYHTNIINLTDATQGGRGDCAGIIQIPYECEIDAEYLAAIENYKLSTLNSVSSYVGIYTPHILVADNYNNRNIWLSGASFVAGKMAAQWQTQQPWLPSAGVERGVIDGLGVSVILSDGDMDSLYDNNINPIRWKRSSGIMIWGQKTLQTRESDLSYMNARVTLCVIKPAITALLEQFLFDMNTLSNTTGTRALINAVITTYMNNVVANGGCYDFEVICNSTNNSAFDVQSHTLNVWLLVHITDDIEYIPFSIGVVGFSISFDIAQGLL